MLKMIGYTALHRTDKQNSQQSLFQHSVSLPLVTLLIVMMCLLPTVINAQVTTAANSNVPPRLNGALGCLVKADFVRHYDLNYLGLKVGDWAWVRYQVGSIPEMGDTPRSFNIVVYSPDGRRGMLLFADPDDAGGFNARVNAYRLHRSRSKWEADYGNGGSAMYEAVGKFVTELSHRPRYKTQLAPGGNECKADESQH